MKTFFSTTMTVVFLLCFTIGIQAQTTQTQLNQIDLMKQWVGTWKCVMAKDTTLIVEYSLFGTALDGNAKVVTKGKTLDEFKMLWGYDEKIDKIIAVQLWQSSPNLRILGSWFTSKTTAIAIPYQNISNPKDATETVNIELKTPDLLIETQTSNGKVDAILTFTHVKK
jgi:hypothetical protein